MERLATVSILLSFFVFSGCVHTVMKVRASPSLDQKIVYSHGADVVVSKKNHFVAVRSVKSELERRDRSEFLVFFKNLSSSPINFSTENITAEINYKIVDVLTYSQLSKDINRKRNSQQFLNTISGALKSYNAPKSGYVNYSGTVYNTNTGGISSFNGSFYDHNSVSYVRKEAQEETETRENEINRKAHYDLHVLDSRLLRRQTVWPDQHYGGVIVLDTKGMRQKSNLLTLDVYVDGEIHQFKFVLSSE